MRPMVDFTLTDENRLVQHSARAFAEAEILPTSASGTRTARSTARSSRRWPSWASSARRSRGVRRRRDGLHQLRHPVRGARAGRHRVPGRPERPRRPQLAGPPAMGDRGAAPALARPAGARREARDIRPDRARRRAPTPPTSRRPRGAMAKATGSTAEDWTSLADLADHFFVFATVDRAKTQRALRRSCSSEAWRACRPARSMASSASGPELGTHQPRRRARPGRAPHRRGG